MCACRLSPSSNLPYPARVLSDERALLEASLKRAERELAGEATRTVAAAPADMPRKRQTREAWVAVRARYEALPAVAGRDRCSGAKPAWIASAAQALGSTVPAKVAATERRRRSRPLLLGNRCRGRYQARLRRPSPSMSRERTKSPTRAAARGSRALGCLKFESEIVARRRHTLRSRPGERRDS